MKTKLTEAMGAVDDLVGLTATWVQQHPKRVVAALAGLMLCSTGVTFALANLDTGAAAVPTRQVVEAVTPVFATTTAAPSLQTLQEQAMRLYRSDTTRANDTAEGLLKRLGIFDPEAAAFLRRDPLAFQYVLGRAGRNVIAESSERNALLKLSVRWSPDDSGTFKRLTIEHGPKGFGSRLETLPLVVTSRLASATIRSSLYSATDEAKIPDSVTAQITEIFSGDVDFHRSLHKGDHLSVIYETLEGDGLPLRAGRVLSVEFVNGGKPWQAMWFQEPGSSKGAYYTLTGESLRRAYLAAPLEFSRITSGFSMRFHPILQTWRAHLGVDYAASTGTPVRTIGDGKVKFAGVQNGYGNVVIVQHRNQQHETLYAHLSQINVRTGEAVTQGQNIGLVGATGWATGPHLHFEFRVGGEHQDPLTMARENSATPISTASRPVFDASANQVRAQFAASAHIQQSRVE